MALSFWAKEHIIPMKNIIYFFIIILIIVSAGFFMIRDQEATNRNTVNTANGYAQEIVIGYKNYNYYPQEIKVNVNEPVRIYLDASVRGCFRDFTIRELGVREYLNTPNDYVEFTPTKSGTYVFACSMGMGTGKLIVE
jgi:plastocyanin domain-containing protein